MRLEALALSTQWARLTERGDLVGGPSRTLAQATVGRQASIVRYLTPGSAV
jgi:hypothetical protein